MIWKVQVQGGPLFLAVCMLASPAREQTDEIGLGSTTPFGEHTSE